MDIKLADMKLKKRKKHLRVYRINKLVFLLPVLLVFIGIGISVSNSLLGFGGSAKVTGNMWDIHFANITPITTEAEITSAAAIDELDLTKVDFGVKLTYGSKYSFTVDVVNDGSMDAKISTIGYNGLTNEQKNYINYTVTYDDGSDINVEDVLLGKSKVTLLVSVEFMSGIDESLYPSSTQTLNLSFNISYVQRFDSTTVKSSGWDVHFENIKVVESNATVKMPASISPGNPTQISFKVGLGPGQKYSFEADIVNSGKYDTKVYSTKLNGLTDEQCKFIDYKVTYTNGQEIQVDDILPAGAALRVAVSVEFKRENADAVAGADSELPLSFVISYVQTDNSEVTDKTNWEVYFDNLTTNKGDAVENMITSINLFDPTKINFGIGLYRGQSYSLEFDVVNNSKYDVKVEASTFSGLSSSQSKYIRATAIYTDGETIKEDDVLKIGDSRRVRITIEYVSGLEENLYSTSNELISLSYKLSYIQE